MGVEIVSSHTAERTPVIDGEVKVVGIPVTYQKYSIGLPNGLGSGLLLYTL
jgi:hypothetical protein